MWDQRINLKLRSLYSLIYKLRILITIWGFPDGSDGKESACKAGEPGSIPGSARSPWRREWLPTLVFLPGKSHGKRYLEGYSPLGHKESEVTERLTQVPHISLFSSSSVERMNLVTAGWVLGHVR